MNIDYFETAQYLDWLKEKLWLNGHAVNAGKRIVFRGEVYECNLGVGVGSEERKKRPCVVLQNNTANKNSSIVLVAPISHSFKVIILSNFTTLSAEVLLRVLRNVVSWVELVE